MIVTLTIIRYPKFFTPVALMMMAIFRLPLYLHKNVSFYKLLGCGQNGTFDKTPDWRQWGILTADKRGQALLKLPANDLLKHLYGNFISKWLRFFNCECWTVLLEPIEGHGSWDGQKPFGPLSKNTDYDGAIAVLTRATIRLKKLKAFWQNVDTVARQMATAPGFITSVGVGEMPFVKQATFSIWQSKTAMKAFAYQLQAHAEVIRKTRKEDWYSEDMFVRFKILYSAGTIRQKNPLAGIS